MAFDLEDWQQQLDRTVDGVFRSFLVIIPAFLITCAVSFSISPVLLQQSESLSQNLTVLPVLPGMLILFVHRFLLTWCGSLIFLVFIARQSGMHKHSVDLIVGYNWLQLMLTILWAMPLMLFAVTGSRELAGTLLIPYIILQVILTWGMLRRALPSLEKTSIIGLMIGLAIIAVLSQQIGEIIQQPFQITGAT